MIQNLSVNILTKYFAKWSTPYQSEFSNTSRFISPFSDIINSNIDKASNVLSMRYRNSESTVYNYVNIVDKIFAASDLYSEVYSVQQEDGSYKSGGRRKLNNIGHSVYTSWTQLPVTGVSLMTPKIDWLSDAYAVEISPGIHKVNKRFVSENKLYIKIVESIDSADVTIVGLDKDFNRIVEKITVGNASVYETFKKFISISRVSAPTLLYITNYVDCSIDHFVSYKHILPNRITNKDGSFIDANVVLNDKTVLIYNYENIISDPIGQFDLKYKPRYLFMDSNSDVYVVDESNWLLASKPSLNYEDTSKNGSCNNNKFIYLEDYEHREGSLMRCKVMAHDIIVRASGPYIRVSVKNDGETHYIDKYGNLTSNDNTWINAADSANIINISIWCDNDKPYVFTVSDQDGNSYSTQSAQLLSNTSNILPDVTAMYIYNSDLYVSYNANMYIVKPLRHSYAEFNDRKISLDSDYKALDTK